MKNITKIFAAAAASLLAFSCTPHFPEAVKSEIPQIANVTPVVTVDQETNYVTFSIKEKGVVPMWLFGEEKVDGKKAKYVYTGNGISLRVRDAGTHTIELKAYNKNGVSQGSKEVTFTLENTYHDPFDPTSIINNLISNEWYWNKNEDGHFGCGPSIVSNDWQGYETYGLTWWSALANEKAEYSLYDDKMVFTADGKYQYDPVDGKTYVNKDSGYKPEFKTGDEDYVVEIDPFESTYTLEQEWNEAGIEEVYLCLESGKNLSYIPNPQALTNPRYLILTNSKRKLDFVIDNGTLVSDPKYQISWRYQFAPKGKEPGLDYEADTNMWKHVDASDDNFDFGFYYAPGWAQIADPEVTHSNDTYTISLPEATSDQWQAQFHIDPNAANAIPVEAGKTYAFSCLVQTNKDLPGMTFKLTDATSDSNFLFEERVEVPAGKEFLFERKNIVMSANTSAENMKMFFDFGGNAADTKVSIRRITLQEYTAPAASINGVPFVGDAAELSFTQGAAVTVDGIELTYIDPDFFNGEAGSMTFAAESGDYRVYNQNGFLKVVPMFAGAPATYKDNGSLWIIGEGLAKPENGSAPGWNTDPAKDLPFAKDGNKYQVTVYVTGPNFKVFGQANWGMELGGDSYTVVEANDYFKINGFPGGADSDNGNIWSGDAFEAGWYVIRLVDNGDGSFEFYADKKKETYYDIDGATNLYKSATINPEFWYSPASWAGGLTPDYTIGANNDFTATMPAGIGGSEWMGQNKLHTGVATSSDKIYDFCCTLEADVDCVVTIKLTGNPEGDGDPHKFFYDGNVVLEAGTPLTYKKAKISQPNSNDDFTVIFDFGRVPEGKTVKATQICFQEHMEK